MDNTILLHRLCNSNIGLQVANAGYQITGKTNGCTASWENDFQKLAASFGKMPEGVSYSEAVLLVNGIAYLTNTSMTVSEDGRPAPIVSAVIAEGNDWRRIMQQPEAVFTNNRDFFYEATPHGAAPGNPAELPLFNGFHSNGDILSETEILQKYGISAKAFDCMMECVYFCLLSCTAEKMMIGLPNEWLNNETTREIMYLICQALPAALRAQLSYKLGMTLKIETLITFGPATAIRAAKNRINLVPDSDLQQEINFKVNGELRGLDFCHKLVASTDRAVLLQRMDAFLAEDPALYNGAGKSVNFSANVVKYGKNYLLAGAWMYAADTIDCYFEDDVQGHELTAFTLLILCSIAGQRTSDLEQRTAWDRVTGGLLHRYLKAPLHESALGEGELRFDESTVKRTLERGWHNISYPGSVLSAEYIAFALQSPEDYEAKCLAQQTKQPIATYTELLNSIYSAADYSMANWPAGKWYELRKLYPKNQSPSNTKLCASLMKGFADLPLESKMGIIGAADYSDGSLAAEFLKYADSVFPAEAGDNYAAEQFVRILDAAPNLEDCLFGLSRFAEMSEEAVYGVLDHLAGKPERNLTELYGKKPFQTQINKEQKLLLIEKGVKSRRDGDALSLLAQARSIGANESLLVELCMELLVENRVDVVELCDQSFVESFSEENRRILLMQALTGGSMTAEKAEYLLQSTLFATQRTDSKEIIFDLVSNQRYCDQTGISKLVLCHRDFVKMSRTKVYEIYQTVVGKYNGASFLLQDVFAAPMFQQLEETEKAALYSLYLSGQCPNENLQQLIQLTNLSGTTEEDKLAIFKREMHRSDDICIELFCSLPFMGMSEEDRFALYKSVVGRSTLMQLLVSDENALSNLSVETEMKLLTAILEQQYCNDALREELYRSVVFAKLPVENRFALVEKQASSLEDFCQHFDNAFLLENASKCEKLENYLEKGIDLRGEGAASQLYFDYLVCLLQPENPYSVDKLKQLTEKSKDNADAFFSRYRKQNAGWGSFTEIADEYYAELTFATASEELTALAERRKQAASDGLSRLEKKYETLIWKQIQKQLQKNKEKGLRLIEEKLPLDYHENAREQYWESVTLNDLQSENLEFYASFSAQAKPEKARAFTVIAQGLRVLLDNCVPEDSKELKAYLTGEELRCDGEVLKGLSAERKDTVLLGLRKNFKSIIRDKDKLEELRQIEWLYGIAGKVSPHDDKASKHGGEMQAEPEENLNYDEHTRIKPAIIVCVLLVAILALGAAFWFLIKPAIWTSQNAILQEEKTAESNDGDNPSVEEKEKVEQAVPAMQEDVSVTEEGNTLKDADGSEKIEKINAQMIREMVRRNKEKTVGEHTAENSK